MLVRRGAQTLEHSQGTPDQSLSVFHKMLEPVFQEGFNNKVALVDETAEAFDHFLEWIDFQNVVETEERIPFEAIYVLADKFCIEAGKSTITDAKLAYCDNYPVPLIDHNLSDRPLIKASTEKITCELAHSHIDAYLTDKEKLTCPGVLLGDIQVMRQFLQHLKK